MLSIKLTGASSIDKDHKAFNTQVYRATQAGLIAVGSELTKQLQQHIRTDVYEAYTPKSYPRRSDFPQFGTPLESETNMDLRIGKMSLMFQYNPSGSHSGVNKDRLDWDSLAEEFRKQPNKPIKPKPVHGDDLIRRIETGRGYDWNVEVPERHFWNNFVDDAVGAHGWTERVFVRAMNEAEPNLGTVSDGRILRDGNDTYFEQQIDMSGDDFDDESFYDDGNLPY